MHRQWPVISLARSMAMLLVAGLLVAPMGAVPEGFNIAGAEVDSKGRAAARPDAPWMSFLLRQGAAFFGIPTTFVFGGASEPSLAVGDFNHDGLPDLVVAEADTNDVWLLPGDGRGGFGPPTRLAVDSRQKIVALGDFDGDGLDDQAVADQFATGVTIRFGDGAGGFRAPPPPQAVGRARVTTILLGDFDQDGAADLAIVDGVSDHVTILLGNAHGEVRSTTSIPVGLAPTALAVGDFNGDGIPDLAVANSLSDDVSILLGDGMGGFGAA